MEAIIFQARWRPLAPTLMWLFQDLWVKSLEGFWSKDAQGPIAAWGVKSEGKALTANPPFP